MGYFVNDAAALTCLEGGQVSLKSTSNTRVCVDGKHYVMTKRDKFEFSRPVCPLPSDKNPCIEATWETPSTRIKVSGEAVILDNSEGKSLKANGAKAILNIKTQSRVKGAL